MPTKILLTGATGFLGGATAAKLLELGRGPEARFLVRAANPAEAKRRLIRSLDRFELDPALLATIADEQVICGGLDSLPTIAGSPRLEEITHVINCAAVTSFGQNPLTWPTNVDHTLAFARQVAAFPHLQRFLHVSTAMICGARPPRVVEEDAYPATNARHLVGYTGSKANAELALRRELGGVPLVFVRPSIIVGHTRLGCKPSGSIFWGFRMADALGMVTCGLDTLVDVIPVDYAATALLHLADAPRLDHATYHVSAGHQSSSSFQDIARAFAQTRGGSPRPAYRQVTYKEIAAQQDQFGAIFGPGNKRTMLAAARLYGEFAGLNTVFDNRRLTAAGLGAPPPFADYLGVCERTSREIPISRQMTVDFE